ncbi:ABC transporter substrate-binding protein [Ancylobacter oerskovii]|uniref:ABC transporter substrate-binding protein n=1 Tax=Ancylobacter oerskovii TaxID=459519 RepID=A0ABW4YVU4_9HYPH|nr:ABC transporter substrate-binding protein [Ancylobacter oerskovii]MBS7544135.1 ABC transporter substrate-binding protein [Ancylobacter oerskovii]
MPVADGAIGRRALLAAALASPLLLAGAPARAGAAPRFVSMDLLITELMLTLGVVPLATPNVALYRRLVADPVLPAEVKDLGPLAEPNLEYLRTLAPDRIVVADWQAAGLENLARIAPLAPVPVLAGGKPAVAHGEELLRVVAALVAAPSRADAAIEACEAALATGRSALGGYPRPVYVCRFNRDGRNLALFGGNGMIGDTLARLGLANAYAGRVNAFGVTNAPLMRLAERPEAVIVHFDRGPETDAALARLAQSPVWQALPAVRAGRVVRTPVVYPNGGPRSATRLALALTSSLAPLDHG